MAIEKLELVTWSKGRILKVYQKPLISIYDEIEYYLCFI